MFKKINKTIEGVLRKQNIKEYKAFLLLVNRWDKKIKEKINNNAEITDYAEETITIQTKNPTWKNELSFLKEELKKNYQQKKLQLNTL